MADDLRSPSLKLIIQGVYSGRFKESMAESITDD